MAASRSPVQLDRDVMALLLTSNVQLAAQVLSEDEHEPGQVMRAIAATRSLDSIVEETLHALVEQARTAGHTWAEIGAVLRVSRQAAFQRFGGGARPAAAEGTVAVPVAGAAEHAVPVLEAFFDGRFDEVRSRFAPRMADAVSVELLAEVREKVRDRAGEMRALGAPVVSVRDGFTVVDIPIALERADGIGRVVLDADREVAGFVVRPREEIG